MMRMSQKAAFEERFKTEMPTLDCKRHRIILAAPRLDASAERIINYLANRYAMDVNAVFFNYVRLVDRVIRDGSGKGIQAIRSKQKRHLTLNRQQFLIGA